MNLVLGMKPPWHYLDGPGLFLSCRHWSLTVNTIAAHFRTARGPPSTMVKEFYLRRHPPDGPDFFDEDLTPPSCQYCDSDMDEWREEFEKRISRMKKLSALLP
jgi:hypothetical protein